MTGKLFGKAFILLIFYLFLCSLIYFISYFALTKKNFIDIPVFKSIQRHLYYELFVEVWQNKPGCISFDEDLIYVPKIGSCRHPNKFGHRKIAQSLYNVLKLDIFNN